MLRRTHLLQEHNGQSMKELSKRDATKLVLSLSLGCYDRQGTDTALSPLPVPASVLPLYPSIQLLTYRHFTRNMQPCCQTLNFLYNIART
eukprot:1160784-Pelagomonas_calceolata.AAC.7